MTLESLTEIRRKSFHYCGLLNDSLLLFYSIFYIQNFPLLSGMVVSYPSESLQTLRTETEHVILVKDGRDELGGAGQKYEARQWITGNRLRDLIRTVSCCERGCRPSFWQQCSDGLQDGDTDIREREGGCSNLKER